MGFTGFKGVFEGGLVPPWSIDEVGHRCDLELCLRFGVE